MTALNVYVSLTESSVYRSKLLKSPPGSFLVDPVYFTTTDTPHTSFAWLVFLRFALFVGNRVEVDGRRAAGSNGHLMHSALKATSRQCIDLHSALNAFS